MTPVGGFRHKITDLLYWIVRYTDGTTVKYVFQEGVPGTLPPVHQPGSTSTAIVKRSSVYVGYGSLKDWCRHDVTPNAVGYFCLDRDLSLTVADSMGVMKASHDDTNPPTWIVDCGQVIHPPFFTQGRMLNGDKQVVDGLRQFLLEPDPIVTPPPYKLLKILWMDRKAPPLSPQFWPALAGILNGDVVINCQGGHGRSGTAFACLLMVLIPDYTPKDAIVHLRAMHCPRAIESVEQHDYLDTVAAYLGREQNAHAAMGVPNFKTAFEASTHPEARRMVEWRKQHPSSGVAEADQEV